VRVVRGGRGGGEGVWGVRVGTIGIWGGVLLVEGEVRWGLGAWGLGGRFDMVCCEGVSFVRWE